jgi:hypothetical protein
MSDLAHDTEIVPDSERKRCEQCKQDKEIELFRLVKNMYTEVKRMSICKKCYGENQEETRRRNEEDMRRRQMERQQQLRREREAQTEMKCYRVENSENLIIEWVGLRHICKKPFFIKHTCVVNDHGK